MREFAPRRLGLAESNQAPGGTHRRLWWLLPRHLFKFISPLHVFIDHHVSLGSPYRRGLLFSCCAHLGTYRAEYIMSLKCCSSATFCVVSECESTYMSRLLI